MRSGAATSGRLAALTKLLHARRARLVLGRVTVFGQAHIACHPGQLSLQPSAGGKISTGQLALIGDVLRLLSKGRTARSICE